jgi:hypothetical protein
MQQSDKCCLLYSFEDPDYSAGVNILDKKEEVLNKNHFCLKTLLSSRMSNSEYQTAIRVMFDIGTSKGKNNNGHTFSGTPLNHSMVETPTIIKKFLSINKVQQLTTIYLSDGASNRISFPVGNSFIESDHKNFQITNKQTRDLVSFLKKTQPTKVVGFFMTGGNSSNKNEVFEVLNQLRYENGNYKNDEKSFDVLKNNGAASFETVYDKYFVITDSIPVNSDDVSKTNISTYFNNRMKSRKILSEFITIMCER